MHPLRVLPTVALYYTRANKWSKPHAPHAVAPGASPLACEHNPRAPPNPQHPRYGVQTRLSRAFTPQARPHATCALTSPQNAMQRTRRGAQPRRAVARDEAHAATPEGTHGCTRTLGQATRRGSDQPRTLSQAQRLPLNVVTSGNRDGRATHDVTYARQPSRNRVNTQRRQRLLTRQHCAHKLTSRTRERQPHRVIIHHAAASAQHPEKQLDARVNKRIRHRATPYPQQPHATRYRQRHSPNRCRQRSTSPQCQPFTHHPFHPRNSRTPRYASERTTPHRRKRPASGNTPPAGRLQRE